MLNRMHDTHFHLDLYNDIPSIINEIESLKMSVIAVTNLPVLYKRLKNKINSKNVHVALGFHPELICQYNKYIPEMWEYIEMEKIIGEVGLDFSNHKSLDEKKQQISFFEELIFKCNVLGKKILSVHSRKSENEVIKIIGSNFNGSVVMHWFTGSMNYLMDAIEADFYFSVNLAMLKSEKGQKILQRLPKNRILLESDGPFVKYYKRKFRPSNMKEIVTKMSSIIKINENELGTILNDNFVSLFGLS